MARLEMHRLAELLERASVHVESDDLAMGYLPPTVRGLGVSARVVRVLGIGASRVAYELRVPFAPFVLAAKLSLKWDCERNQRDARNLLAADRELQRGAHYALRRAAKLYALSRSGCVLLLEHVPRLGLDWLPARAMRQLWDLHGLNWGYDTAGVGVLLDADYCGPELGFGTSAL